MRAKGWGSLGTPRPNKSGAKVTLTSPPTSRARLRAAGCGAPGPRRLEQKGLPRHNGRGGGAGTRKGGAAALTGPVGVGAAARSRGCRSEEASSRCATSCTNYLGHVMWRRRQPASARRGDSARRDVSEDAPPSPAPLALSAVLKAQGGGLPGLEERRSCRPQGEMTPSVWETWHASEPLNPGVLVQTLRRVNQKKAAVSVYGRIVSVLQTVNSIYRYY